MRIRSPLYRLAPLLLLAGIAGALSGCGGASLQNGASAMGASLGGSPYGYYPAPENGPRLGIVRPTTSVWGH